MKRGKGRRTDRNTCVVADSPKGEPNAGGCFARRDSRERPASFAIP